MPNVKKMYTNRNRTDDLMGITTIPPASLTIRLRDLVSGWWSGLHDVHWWMSGCLTWPPSTLGVNMSGWWPGIPDLQASMVSGWWSNMCRDYQGSSQTPWTLRCYRCTNAWSPPGVCLDSTWTPGILLQNSMDTPWSPPQPVAQYNDLHHMLQKSVGNWSNLTSGCVC